jgi:hypothetical protein
MYVIFDPLAENKYNASDPNETDQNKRTTQPIPDMPKQEPWLKSTFWTQPNSCHSAFYLIHLVVETGIHQFLF